MDPCRTRHVVWRFSEVLIVTEYKHCDRFYVHVGLEKRTVIVCEREERVRGKMCSIAGLSGQKGACQI